MQATQRFDSHIFNQMLPLLHTEANSSLTCPILYDDDNKGKIIIIQGSDVCEPGSSVNIETWVISV
jgi:hypothetical protein